MSARKTRRPDPRSSSHRGEESRLKEAFLKVRTLVHSVTGRFANVLPKISCPGISVLRRTGEGYLGSRAFMHVGHHRNRICMARQAALLSDSHLVGLLLHEFGHLGGGEGEPEANGWVLSTLGIAIVYKAPMDLQWVPLDLANRILG